MGRVERERGEEAEGEGGLWEEEAETTIGEGDMGTAVGGGADDRE